MSSRTQMWCLWCGPAGLGLFVIGFWVIAGFVPPPSPHDSPAQTAALFDAHRDAIRIGLILTQVAATLTAPWVAAISVQMRRVEGRFSPLAYVQLGLGMLSILLFIFPVTAWEAAAFRPDRDPALIQLVNDLAWLPFVGVFAPASLQLIAVAVCAFKDVEEKVFPRWTGWLNVYMALGFMPVCLIYFFKTGPFAWNGLVSFWIPFSLFWLWFVVMFVVLRRAIGRQARAAPAAA